VAGCELSTGSLHRLDFTEVQPVKTARRQLTSSHSFPSSDRHGCSSISANPDPEMDSTSSSMLFGLSLLRRCLRAYLELHFLDAIHETAYEMSRKVTLKSSL
jgi:hypothetical protein